MHGTQLQLELQPLALKGDRWKLALNLQKGNWMNGNWLASILRT